MHDARVMEYLKIIERERLDKRDAQRLVRLAQASRAAGTGDLSQSPGSANSRLGVPSLSTRAAQAARAFWWVPAGFAVLFLLRFIVGA